MRLSWPLWLICGLYVEELTRKSTIIEQWLLISTEDGRKCAAYQYGYLWYIFAWSQRVSKWTRYGSLRCEHIGFSIQVAFSEVLEMWFKVIIFIKPYKHFISFHVSFWASSKLILTFTKWGGVACETTSVHGPQCNFRQHLLHHNTSSIAFSMNDLKSAHTLCYEIQLLSSLSKTSIK